MYERYQRMTPEERRAEVLMRDQEKVRRADRERYYRDREKRRALMDKWAAANPGRVLELKKEWIERNPEKRAAHIVVNNAVRDGRLGKGECEMRSDGECKGRVHAHHDDYSKVFEVRWLCAEHHGRQHWKAS